MILWLGVIILLAALIIRSCNMNGIKPTSVLEIVPDSIPVENEDDNLNIDKDGYDQVFADVPQDSWYWRPVHAMNDMKIMTGYDSGTETGYVFKPEQSVSLQQLAKIAVTSTDTKLSSCSSYATEPAGSGWAIPYIHCLRYRGVTVYENLDQDFSKPATRAEVATVMVEAFGRRIEADPSISFGDVDGTTKYSAAILTLAHDKIVIGKNKMFGKNMFEPTASISRAEMSALIHRTIDAYAK